LFDLPIYKYKNELKFIKNKKKIISNYWPYIPPQSCITIKRDDFIIMFKKINFNLFPDIWMDFRVGLYQKYIKKDFNVLDKNLTYYRQSQDMISSNFKFLSFAWWRRRKQAHDYVQYFFDKNKINHQRNLDYLLTNLIHFFIKHHIYSLYISITLIILVLINTKIFRYPILMIEKASPLLSKIIYIPLLILSFYLLILPISIVLKILKLDNINNSLFFRTDKDTNFLNTKLIFSKDDITHPF